MARLLMMLGLAGPAFLLVFFSQFWIETFSFAHQTLPRLLQIILGLVALAGASMIPFTKTREVGYIVGAAFFGVLTSLGVSSSFFVHVSEMVFIFPMVFWFYLEGAMTTVRDKVRITSRKRD